MTVRSGQVIKIAPKEVQQLNRLLATNWLLATSDGKNVGLVPCNYIKRNEVSQIRQIEREDEQPQNQSFKLNEEIPVNTNETSAINGENEKESTA